MAASVTASGRKTSWIKASVMTKVSAHAFTPQRRVRPVACVGDSGAPHLIQSPRLLYSNEGQARIARSRVEAQVSALPDDSLAQPRVSLTAASISCKAR